MFLDFDHEMDGRFRAHEGTPAVGSSISNDAPAVDAFGDAGRDPYFLVAH